jgi:hypothetical protein
MKTLLYSALFAAAALASPTPTTPEEIPNKRDSAASSTITSPSQLESIVAGLEADGAALSAGASVLADVVEAIVPSPAPSNISAALSSVASVYAAHPTDFLVSGFDLILNGLAPQDLVEDALAESPFENSENNTNPIPANPPVYPQKGVNDAPYSVSEQTLRGAIYIPPGFQYGKVPPVIFIPGTASTGGEAFGPNFGKLFAGSDYADPIYLSVPGAQLNDIQVNAEYIAYAINYISSISGHTNVSLLSWSAGSVGTAWAFTYWPSTRSIVSNDIVISADYHGTILAYFLCPGFPQLPCAPSVIQVL